MSAFYDKLVENGYRPRDLDDLSQDQLALLVQETFVENAWSIEARMMAIAARRESAKRKAPRPRPLSRHYRKPALRRVSRTRSPSDSMNDARLRKIKQGLAR